MRKRLMNTLVCWNKTTLRQFGKRIKEHVSKSIDEFLKTSNKENKSIRLINASKRSAIAEHLLITLIEQVIITWKDFKLLKIVLILLL